MTSEVGILGPFPMPDLERGLTDESVCQVWIHGACWAQPKEII